MLLLVGAWRTQAMLKHSCFIIISDFMKLFFSVHPTVKESLQISNQFPKTAIPSSYKKCWSNSRTKSCASPCQLIQPFIWWLTTTGIISSSCGRWSAEEKLAQSANLHLYIHIHKTQMAVGVTFAAARALKKLTWDLLLKIFLPLLVKEPKSKAFCGITKTLNKKGCLIQKKYIKTESGIACARYIYISFFKMLKASMRKG